MTPKKKAWSIFWNFKNIPDKWKNEKVFQNYYAKQCALLAVDEIIEQWIYIDTYLGNGNGELNPNLKYWKEVKQEIQKL